MADRVRSPGRARCQLNFPRDEQVVQVQVLEKVWCSYIVLLLRQGPEPAAGPCPTMGHAPPFPFCSEAAVSLMAAAQGTYLHCEQTSDSHPSISSTDIELV